MIDDYTSRQKTTRSQFRPNGIYFGLVTRVDATTQKVWVEISRLAEGFQFGPLLVASPVLPVVGDTVTCQFVENRADDIVVVGIVKPVLLSPAFGALFTVGLAANKPLMGLAEGSIYYETDTDLYKTWNGSAWVAAAYIRSGLSADKPLTSNVEGALYYETDTGLYQRWASSAWSVLTVQAGDPINDSRFGAIMMMEIGA